MAAATDGAMNDANAKRKRDDGGGERRRGPPRSHARAQPHRFGRVMSQPPRLGPRDPARAGGRPTVSIALPGSCVANAQTRELQTQLAGQIARAAAVYRVDEIVVFDDGLGGALATASNYRRGPARAAAVPRAPRATETEAEAGADPDADPDAPRPAPGRPREQLSTDPHTFLARLLQYIECPQYLRRKFFPMHPDLQFAGLLPPLDAPHHLRRGDVAPFREGVVVERGGGADADGPGSAGGDGDAAGGSFVECGVPNRVVQIDRTLAPGLRCTVKLDLDAYVSKQQRAPSDRKGVRVMKGTVVSPATPRDEAGIYWGYTTRMAASINAIFAECPYAAGYDLKVGTSERGDVSIDDPKFRLRKRGTRARKPAAAGGAAGADADRFDHLLIVFGGVAGIEEAVDADETMALSGAESKKMFDVWVNLCPYQGSRTVRTEEAVVIGLARLSPHIARNGAPASRGKRGGVVRTEEVEFSDEAVSEESSEGE